MGHESCPMIEYPMYAINLRTLTRDSDSVHKPNQTTKNNILVRRVLHLTKKLGNQNRTSDS